MLLSIFSFLIELQNACDRITYLFSQIIAVISNLLRDKVGIAFCFCFVLFFHNLTTASSFIHF